MRILDRIIRLYLAVIAVGFLMTLPAYGQDMSWSMHPPPLFPTNEWGAVTNDCQLGLRAPQFEYTVGERIIAFLTMRNVGDKSLAYFYTDKYMDYEVLVKSIGGQIVPYTDWWAGMKDHLQPFSSGHVGVPPHQQQLYFHWLDVTELYKMDQPGTYVITVKQRVHLQEIPSEQPLKTRRIGIFDILSNPVTITLTAPATPKHEK